MSPELDNQRQDAHGDLYRAGWAWYRQQESAGVWVVGDAARAATQERVVPSAQHLADQMHEAPVLVEPCIGRRPATLTANEAGLFRSVIPARA